MIYILIIPVLITSAAISYVVVSQKARKVNDVFTSRLSDFEKYNAKIRRDVSELRTLVDDQTESKDAYTLIVESHDGNKYRFKNVTKFVDGSDVSYAAYGLYEHGNGDTLKVFTDNTDEPHAIVDRADIRAVYKEDAKCGCMGCENISRERD